MITPSKAVPLEHQILPQPLTPADRADLEKEIQQFGEKALQTQVLKKMTPRLTYQAEQLLMVPEDPFLVAVYLKVPFVHVAKIANNILERAGLKGRIPEDVPTYLKLAALYTPEVAPTNPPSDATS